MQGSLSWNEAKHSADLDTKFGGDKLRAEFRLKSTVDKFDDIFGSIRHEKPGNEIKTEIVAKYQNIEMFKFLADLVPYPQSLVNLQFSYSLAYSRFFLFLL